MADRVVQKPGFSDRTNYPSARETRNRRVSRFDAANGGANRTANRHRRYEANTIAFPAAGDEITDTANGLGIFDVGQRIGVAGSTSNDGEDAGEISVVAAGQLDTVEANFSTEAAGANVILKGRGNKSVRRFAGFP